MRLRHSAVLLVLLLISCGKELPTLDGIDTDEWKKDKNACHGARQSMESTLRREFTKLKGLAEMDVIKLLGRPDQNELYKRNQKFYYYSISPGPGCGSKDTTALKLVLRFNAMGYAQLVSIE